jgi:general secretion pathway protein J
MLPADTSGHARHGERGFTIIEMLVSLTIIAVIMGLLGSGLRVLSQNADRNAGRIEALDMLSRAFDILRRDLAGLQRIVVVSDKKPHFLFKGTPQRMSFVAAEPPYPTPDGLYFLDYAVSVAGGTAELIRARAPYQLGMLSFPGATPANRVQLVQAPVEYRFSYGRSTASGLKWYSTWPYPKRVPNLARLEIIDPKTKQRVAPLMIAVVRANAEIGCLNDQSGFCSVKTDGELMAGLDVDANAYSKK